MKAIEANLIPCLILFVVGLFAGFILAGYLSTNGQYCYNKQHQIADQLNRIMTGSGCPPTGY